MHKHPKILVHNTRKAYLIVTEEPAAPTTPGVAQMPVPASLEARSKTWWTKSMETSKTKDSLGKDRPIIMTRGY